MSQLADRPTQPQADRGAGDDAGTSAGRGGSKVARYGLQIVAATVLVLAGGGAGAAVALHYAGGTTTVTASAPPAAGGQSAASQSLAKAAAAALPSVVTIMVNTPGASGEGSGVILRSDGMILTNNHVVAAAADGAGAIKVIFADGKTKPATIVGQDQSADIAVIQAYGVSGLTPAQLGSAADLRVGDTVLAIGSPLGLTDTVTSGIVSALHRSITAGGRSEPNGSGSTAEVLSDMIQTDAPINPGNSGGALLDASGRVVGITTAIATLGGSFIGQQSGSIGVGFAIPINTAYNIATQLMGR